MVIEQSDLLLLSWAIGLALLAIVELFSQFKYKDVPVPNESITDPDGVGRYNAMHTNLERYEKRNTIRKANFAIVLIIVITVNLLNG